MLLELTGERERVLREQDCPGYGFQRIITNPPHTGKKVKKSVYSPFVQICCELESLLLVGLIVDGVPDFMYVQTVL
jgi:hypothetical protein